MGLTSQTISQKIFEALRDSAEILAACKELFDLPQLVCLGLSGEDAPPPEDCPVFEVISWNKERGDAPDNWPLALSVNIFIQDAGRTRETMSSGVRSIVNRGPQSLETLMDLAEAAIRAALAELDFDDLSFDYDAITFFPLFAGALNMTVSFPKLGGGGFTPTL
jgi:hypothetical protein